MSQPRVLVVDDEPGVLQLVAYALTIPGYEVHAVPGPVAALQLVKAVRCFDLIVSDVIMPEMCGPELVSKVKQVCPRIAVVMMSAHIAGEMIPRGAGFISKPFLLPDLFSVVEKTMARSLT